MKAIDIHAHIFSRVNGANNFGSVVSEKFGRVINGGEVKPFMPPLSPDTSFAVDALLELMSRTDVEKAVIMQNPTIGIINDEVAAAIKAHSSKFTGVVQVDPFKAGAAETLERELQKGNFAALKLEMSDDWGWLSIYGKQGFAASELFPLFDVVKARGLKVIVDTGAVSGSAYIPEEYRRMAESYGDVQFIFEHQGYLDAKGAPDKWLEMIKLGKLPNVSFGISAAGHIMGEAYPCPDTMERLSKVVKLLGAEKLMWGSDLPTTLNRYTYQQMKDMVVLHTPFLTEREREMILYTNADKMFF